MTGNKDPFTLAVNVCFCIFKNNRSNDKETQMQRMGLIYTFSTSTSTPPQTQCYSLMETQTKILTLIETQAKMLTLKLTVNGP